MWCSTLQFSRLEDYLTACTSAQSIGRLFGQEVQIKSKLFQRRKNFKSYCLSCMLDWNGFTMIRQAWGHQFLAFQLIILTFFCLFAGRWKWELRQRKFFLFVLWCCIYGTSQHSPRDQIISGRKIKHFCQFKYLKLTTSLLFYLLNVWQNCEHTVAKINNFRVSVQQLVFFVLFLVQRSGLLFCCARQRKTIFA